MAFFGIIRGDSGYREKCYNQITRLNLPTSYRDFPELNASVYCFTWKSQETAHFLELKNGDFICSVGTLIYKNKYGDSALKHLYDDFFPLTFDYTSFQGHYSIVIKKNNLLYVFNDALGSWRVFKSADNNIISSSFYFMIEFMENLSLDRQGVYEYVWNGCTFGARTVAEQISSINPNLITIISKDNTKTHAIPNPIKYTRSTDQRSFNDIVSDYSERLLELFQSYNNIPNAKFNSALSGGFDSRLILACCHKLNLNTELYVYGSQNDPDVIIAKDVTNTIGVNLDAIDKSMLYDKKKDELEDLSVVIKRNFFFYDAWTYNGIFDNGIEYLERCDRVKNNRILFNGSAGEVLRHFYYLPNNALSMKDFISSFFCRYRHHDMTNDFNEKEYQNNIEQALKAALNIDTNQQSLSREEIELAYPLFRARYWSSRDMVNNHKFGLSLYPFFEPSIINGTSSIPFNKKIYGRMEAKLIDDIAPEISKCNSSYGYSFNNEPPLSYKLKTQLITYRRPIILRKHSYRIQHFNKTLSLPSYLNKNNLTSILDTDYPYMSLLFNISEINNSEVLNRVLTLEYMSQSYNFLS